VATLRRIAGDLLWDGGCHPLLMRAGDSLAAGRGDDAIRWFQWTLDNLTHELGPDRPDVIEAGAAWATPSWRRSGSRLRSLSLNAVPSSSRPAGPACRQARRGRSSPPLTQAAGPYPDAITLYWRTLADWERAQGDRTMTTRHGLVGSYLASARAKEALAAYKRVAAGRERVLRPDHLDTPRRGTTSAPPPRRRARRRVRSCLRAGLGRVRAGARPRHPDALRSRASLAQVYSRLGRYGDVRARCCPTRSTAWSASCPRAIR
jgi:hypothetical protein